ncbi:MAG: cupin domain-containing protein [Acidobacteria bacterium]|nr:cupin domain-containing protein [Acidobacteriota bacterium]
MSIHDDGYSVLLPEAQSWRPSNIMKISNTDLMKTLGGADRLGGRLWRLPAYSANTWHRHVDSWELYFLLEGVGRMRIGNTTVTVPRYGSVLVAPQMLRQVFNDTPDDALWLIVAAPQEAQTGAEPDLSRFYPEDPKTLPPELAGRVWPPR